MWGVLLWVRFSDVEDVDVVGCGIRARGGDIEPSLDIVGCNAEVGEHKCLLGLYRREKRERKGTGRRGSERTVSEGCRGEKGYTWMRYISGLCVTSWDGVGGTIAGDR